MERRSGGIPGAESEEKNSTSEIVHGLRNAATSVSLAIHSLSQSSEIRSNAGQLRLQIAHKELETIRHLLDELESIEWKR